MDGDPPHPAASDPAAAWQVVIGRLSAEEESALASDPAPTLWVQVQPPAEHQDPAETLQQLGEACWRATAVLQPDEGSGVWYRYNDPRQDGCQGLEELRPKLPNLRLLDHQPIGWQRFDTLWQSWRARETQLAEQLFNGTVGRLWLHRIAPAPVLNGMGPWLSHCGEVIWTPATGSLPCALAELPGSCRLRLRESHLGEPRAIQDSPLQSGPGWRWRQDRVQSLSAICREQRDSLQRLGEEHQQLIAREAELRQRCDDLAGERDRLSGWVDALQQELERTRTLLAALTPAIAGGSPEAQLPCGERPPTEA